MKIDLTLENIFDIEMKKGRKVFQKDYYFVIKYYDAEVYGYDKILKLSFTSEELEKMYELRKKSEDIDECIKMSYNRIHFQNTVKKGYAWYHKKKAKFYSSFYPKAINLSNLFGGENNGL